MQSELLSLVSPEYPWKDYLHYFPELDSTNTRLKELARQGFPHGTCLIAGHQTGGRGRMGRTFLSPEGMGVYLSILLRPNCSPGQLMHLTCAAAVACCDAIEKTCGFRPGIKWTNDLVHNKRKLGGILTEMGLTPQGTVDYCIIGIGINCSQVEEDFAPEIREMAGSLSMVIGEAVSRSAVAVSLLESLQAMDAGILTKKETVLQRYRTDCVTLKKDISLLRGNEIRHGKALDITPDGALVVLFPDGHVEEINSGEVSIRGMYGYL